MSSQTQQLIEAIHAAAAENASPSAKERGAEACKTLGALFCATPGEPLVAQAIAPTPFAQAIDQVRGANASVLLDALITKLKSYVPEEEPSEDHGPSLKVPFVPIPTQRGRNGSD